MGKRQYINQLEARLDTQMQINISNAERMYKAVEASENLTVSRDSWRTIAEARGREIEERKIELASLKSQLRDAVNAAEGAIGLVKQRAYDQGFDEGSRKFRETIIEQIVITGLEALGFEQVVIHEDHFTHCVERPFNCLTCEVEATHYCNDCNVHFNRPLTTD